MTAEEELRHLAAAESEMRREFPNVPAYNVREAIEIESKAFERAPIRGYVPTRDATGPPPTALPPD